MLVALSEIASAQAQGTEATMNAAVKLQNRWRLKDTRRKFIKFMSAVKYISHYFKYLRDFWSGTLLIIKSAQFCLFLIGQFFHLDNKYGQ